MADEEATTIAASEPTLDQAVTPPAEGAVTEPQQIEIPDLEIPSLPQQPQQSQGETEGAKLIRQLVETNQQIAQRIERLEKMRLADPLADLDVQPNKSADVPDYVKAQEERLARIEKATLMQSQVVIQQKAAGVYANETEVVKGLVESWTSDPNAKLFTHKPQAKDAVVANATARINQEIANGINAAVRSGHDPFQHGITDIRARQIFNEEYNRAATYARLFSTHQQVAAQAAVNANSGVPSAGASPDMGATKADEEPDPRNREAWLDFQAKRGTALWNARVGS